MAKTLKDRVDRLGAKRRKKVKARAAELIAEQMSRGAAVQGARSAKDKDPYAL